VRCCQNVALYGPCFGAVLVAKIIGQRRFEEVERTSRRDGWRLLEQVV
jgi:hypothetical protein